QTSGQSLDEQRLAGAEVAGQADDVTRLEQRGEPGGLASGGRWAACGQTEPGSHSRSFSSTIWAPESSLASGLEMGDLKRQDARTPRPEPESPFSQLPGVLAFRFIRRRRRSLGMP